MDEGRGGLLTTGGILSVLVGAFQVLGGAVVLVGKWLGCMPLGVWFHRPLPGLEGAPLPDLPYVGLCAAPVCPIIVGGVLVVLGIIAIAGGVSAIQRKSFGLALAGAICALPSLLFGILAVIFVSLGRGEFVAEY